ncbi:MAG: homoserine kinase [Gemmatimonadota bacterium]|nr:homoserine kinase [Gemmatimonadota bacterium]MDH4347494.1 homoserine kinase [Gemmatimonadota bacterium]
MTSRTAAPVRVFAPGAIGNIGPGLDILGMAVEGLGDTVEATHAPGPGVTVTGSGHASLPTDPNHHSSALAAREALRLAGATTAGVALRVTKGLPLAGGQGGSAASAVAGALATDRLLELGLSERQLAEAALYAEERVAGRHLDNILPCLLGGIILVRSAEDWDVVRVPAPPGLVIVLAHPEQEMRTARARAALPATVPLAVALHQAAQVGAMTLALAIGDIALLGRAIDDRIAEPARAPLLPGFPEAKRAALEAGALGCSISGSGPTTFAFSDSDATARRIARAMQTAYRQRGLTASTRITRVSQDGARVLEGER